MKLLHYLNLFFVGLPILLALIGIFEDDFLVFALLSTLLTGGYQTLMGLLLFITNADNPRLRVYAVSVLGYFVLAFVYSHWNFHEYVIFNYLLIGIPPILAIYFSAILYKKVQR